MRFPRRHGRRHRLLALAVVVVLFLVLTAVLFVWPSTNAPRRSNAIIVLGGSGGASKGLALARAGNAPDLVISDPDHAPCTTLHGGATVICFTPDPSTTQGEARTAAKLARQRGWRQIIVVPSTPQTTRARIRFDRCYSGTVLFDPVSPNWSGAWLYKVIYEWGALVKALTLQREC